MNSVDNKDTGIILTMQMLRIGEESGRLPDGACRVSTFYEARLDLAYTRAIAMIGPATMMGVSMLIAWLIISVMTTLMRVNDLAQIGCPMPDRSRAAAPDRRERQAGPYLKQPKVPEDPWGDPYRHHVPGKNAPSAITSLGPEGKGGSAAPAGGS